MEERRNFSFGVLLLVGLAVLVFGVVGFPEEEPNFKVRFNFGQVGINAEVFDRSSGKKLSEDKVHFTALPGSADSVGEIERIKISAPGYKPKVVTSFSRISLNMGFISITTIEIGKVYLEPKQPPQISIRSRPSGADIYIDGTFRGSTPKRGIELEPGSHRIRLSKSGYHDWSETVYLETGESKNISSDRAGLRKKNQAPSADFTFSPSRPSSSDSLRFLDRSRDNDGYIEERKWEFGDGSRAWGEEVSHRYGKSGRFTVRLTVFDDDGASDSTSETIDVSEVNKKPKADFTYYPKRPKLKEELNFVSNSSDPDGHIKKWKWSFGDGSKSSKPNPKHNFRNEGEYRVQLTVTDNKGAKDSTYKRISFSNEDPRPSFKISPSRPEVDQEVKFDATESSDPDGEIKKYSWDFDNDGKIDRSGEKPEASFSFSSSGGRKVILYVTDDGGSRAKKKKTLKVVEKREDVEIEEKHALVIGITEYKDPSLNNLYFPADDAQSFSDTLLDEEIGGFKKGKVTTLTNEEATTQRIEDALKKLVTEVDENDLMVIYFSGHGARGSDPDGDEKRRDKSDTQDEYFVTYDTDPTSAQSIYETALRDDEFSNYMKSLQTDQVAVFLDSCYSGGQTKGSKNVSIPGQKAPQNNTVFSDFADFDELALFAASQENQSSYEPPTPKLRDKLGHGIFTYYLLRGLKGKADQNEDGLITAEELKGYVKPNVKGFVKENLVGAQQVPLFKGEISAPLTSKSKGFGGRVTAVVGEKESAEKGDRVLISLGKSQGVKKGDRFQVYHVYEIREQVITEERGKIEVESLVGNERSLCKVLNSVVPIKTKDQIRPFKVGQRGSS